MEATAGFASSLITQCEDKLWRDEPFTWLQLVSGSVWVDAGEDAQVSMESIGLEDTVNQLKPLIDIAEAMGQKYDVVVTNPPYMGASNMNSKLSEFIKNHYADYKSDFFSAFIVRGSEMTKPNGYCGYFTPYVWMFIQSYEKLRQYLYTKATIETLIQFEYSAFEEATVPVCTFAFRNSHISKKGCYLRLVDFRGGMEVQRQKTLEAIANHNCGFYYEQNTDNFSKIPGSPVAYWASEVFLTAFSSSPTVGNIAIARSGLSTGNNDRFMRLWYEPSADNIAFGLMNNSQYIASGKKYVPCNKGGLYRRWYGNNEYVIDWENPDEMHRPRTTYMDLYYQPAITWSAITSSLFNARFYGKGYLFDHAAASLFTNSEGDRYFTLGYLNSNVGQYILSMINPTINTGADVVTKMPFRREHEDVVIPMVEENISISISDWDSFETSWDFEEHPLV